MLLIAFDGSDGARAAVRAAGALFPGRRSVVVTVHGAGSGIEGAAPAAGLALPDSVIAGGLAALDRARAERARATVAEGAAAAESAGLEAAAETVAAPGSPWHGICEAANRHDAEAVVCGTRGLGGVARAVLGSTASALLHHAERPILVVPEDPGGLTGPVVVGYDGSEAARAAIGVAARLVPAREAVVVNVWESALQHTLVGRALADAPLDEIRGIAHDVDDHFRSVAAAIAEEGAAAAREQGMEARGEAFEAGSSPWHGVLKAAEATGAAAVVVGSRGRRVLSSFLLGSVASGLVHNAELPVLVTRS